MLALDAYAHFTSPIRRYPDLLVHRAIKWVNEKGSFKGYRYTAAEMEQLGEHTSRTERRADDATREVAERLKCIYLKDHVGETFDVLVSGVAPFGLFVRVPTEDSVKAWVILSLARKLLDGAEADETDGEVNFMTNIDISQTRDGKALLMTNILSKAAVTQMFLGY